jgi:class I fructose-bisphosphate aldolase
MDIFLTKGRGLLLAYDQGLEHGPTDFNQQNVDPAFVMNLGVQGQFNAAIFQKGLAGEDCSVDEALQA